MQKELAAKLSKEVGSTFLFSAFAKGCQQVPVLDAGRAGGFTGKATKASINVRKCFFEGKAFLEHVLHEDDSTAWGVHFLSHDLVRRAGGETKPAVYTGLHGLGH
jgi:hypothetical protein